MKYSIQYRILEMIPGILIVITLFGAMLLSFLKPIFAMYFIIAFDIYWLLRILYLLIYMISSWKKYQKDIQIDWMQKIYDEKLPWENYIHLIFLPVYKEPYEVIETTFSSLTNSDYPLKQFIIVLSGEERGGREEFLYKAEKIKEKYKDIFNDIFIIIHPAGLPNELPGKGSNLHYAGWQIKKKIDKWEFNYDKIIVSCFDIDTCPHEKYFSYLAYKYITHKNPTRVSFQPIAIYNNNVWQSNPMVRVVASSTTFWLLTDLARPEKLFTFSSHSMSFRALVDVGFWDKTIVSEDSRIFLQCFYHYNGDYAVEPLHITVSMNTVDIGVIKKSLINQYKQMRRWAWGVEHFPWMCIHFFGKKRNKNIPLIKKMKLTIYHLEGMYSWATAPLLTYLVGYIPIWTAGKDITHTTIYQNTPTLLSELMTISMIGLITIAILYYFMLPPLPHNFKKYNYLIIFFQWFLVPITLIVFGSMPSIDSQIRLMIGGKLRLGFWVTEKTKME